MLRPECDDDSTGNADRMADKPSVNSYSVTAAP